MLLNPLETRNDADNSFVCDPVTTTGSKNTFLQEVYFFYCVYNKDIQRVKKCLIFRVEDQILLEMCREEESYEMISAKLKTKTVKQVEDRFNLLLKLLVNDGDDNE